MTVKPRLLFVSHSPESEALYGDIFPSSDYMRIFCRSAAEALNLYLSHCPDAIIIDVLENALGEAAFVDSLRRRVDVPIIVVFHFDNPKRRIAALDCGADDCIIAPFIADELAARVRGALRRSLTRGLDINSAYNQSFSTDEMTVDFRTHKVLINGQNVMLTQMEFRIVSMLARHADSLVTYDELALELWGQSLIESNQIMRVNMSNIRRKLGPRSDGRPYIETRSGEGYILSSD